MIRTFHRIPEELGHSILAKFNCTCTQCGSKQDVIVHHIERVAKTDPKFVEESNLTVLCRACHMSYHRTAGDIIPAGAGAPKGSRNNPNGRRGTSEPIWCTIPGCNTLQHAKFLCRKHYTQENRHRWKR